jgi:hypothetical protein
MAIQKKSLIAEAKHKESGVGRSAKPAKAPEPEKSGAAKRLAVAKLVTAKLSTTKLLTLKKLTL